MAAVELKWAMAGMRPTGTGSYSYWSSFRITVENLAFSKVVGVWGRSAGAALWSFYPARHDVLLACNKEAWVADVQQPLDRFVVKYEVNGTTYWDNSAGHDYYLDAGAAQSTDGVGTAALGGVIACQENPWVSGGRLRAGISVQNLYYAKHVGIRFTTDHWATYQDAMATHQASYKPDSLTFQPQVESWMVDVPVGGGVSSVEYAAFFDGHWDSNCSQNYRLPPTLAPAQKRAAQEKPEPRVWAAQPLKAGAKVVPSSTFARPN